MLGRVKKTNACLSLAQLTSLLLSGYPTRAIFFLQFFFFFQFNQRYKLLAIQIVSLVKLKKKKLQEKIARVG